jgi:hypothetical protein
MISIPTLIVLLTTMLTPLLHHISMSLASLYKDNGRKPSLDFDKPLFGYKHDSFQKILANAKKTAERAKFINKIKSRRLACANRAKSIS